MPICFALAGDTLYTAIDEKPKRTRALRRLRNIEANPTVEVLIDDYDEDWSRLWWVRLRGTARVTELHAHALELLQAKYEQYRAAPPAGPLIEVAIEERVEWASSNRSALLREDACDDPTKEETMAVMMMAELPGATPAMYDQVNEKMGISAANLPQGLISHQAGPTDEGMLIVDVWESAEAFERFAREEAGPVFEQLGVPPIEPRILPVHNMIEKGRGERAGTMMIIEMQGLGPAEYDALVSKMDAHVADGSNHPAVSHTAAHSNGGLLVVDVWDSPESFGRFAEEQIGPASGGSLGPIEPRFVPIHNRFTR